MSARSFPLICAATALAAALQAQSPSPAPSAPAKSAPTPAAKSTKFIPTKTPWGDPDLQGWFTNLSEDGTPLERPDQFAGRKLDDIKGEELQKIKADVQKRTVTVFQGPLHAPEHWWQDDLNLTKGSQAWFVVDPPDGKIPALTQQGKDRAAARAAAKRASGHGPADSWEDLTLYDRCITRGLPGSMMPVIYGNSYQILQAPGIVAIRYEMVHETRVIPVVAAGKSEPPHTAPAIKSYMGDPRGHWEGDTLVIETVNFRDGGAYRGANGATLKLTERFRRTANNKVQWAVTVEDPETWTAPWTFTMPLTQDASQPVLEYGCHEGNYGLRNILSGARAAEKQAAEKAAKK